MDGYWPVLFMLILLKIPAIGMIWLLYWAATNEQENGVLDEGEDGGGGSKRRPMPFIPRGPRRGPHGGGSLKPSPGRSRAGQTPSPRRLPVGGRQADPARARERDPAHSRN